MRVPTGKETAEGGDSVEVLLNYNKGRNIDDKGWIPFRQASGIILCYHCAPVTVAQRSLHLQKGVHVPPKMVRTEGLQL